MGVLSPSFHFGLIVHPRLRRPRYGFLSSSLLFGGFLSLPPSAAGVEGCSCLPLSPMISGEIKE
jgi:hypothetical protein